VSHASNEECGAQYQQHVGQDGAEKRELDNAKEAVPERKDADCGKDETVRRAVHTTIMAERTDQLRRISEGGVEQTALQKVSVQRCVASFYKGEMAVPGCRWYEVQPVR
jgi:hypothetical protein